MDVQEPCIGFIPLRFKETGPEVLLVFKRKHDLFGYPKGHRELGETDIETGIRELKEETGCVPDLFLAESGWTDQTSLAKRHPDMVREYVRRKSGIHVVKTTWLFVAVVHEDGPISDQGEIERMQWFPLTPETAEAFVRPEERTHYMTHVLPLSAVARP